MVKNLGLLSLVACSLSAQQIAFDVENLSLDSDSIQIISSFDEVDYFCVYSYSGDLIWEIPFNSRIISWKKTEGKQLFILSKNRNGLVCYLTCIDAASGKLCWEKSILSPNIGNRASDS